MAIADEARRAKLDAAWVVMVPLDNRETPEAGLWPPNRTGVPFGRVPDEFRTLANLSGAHYLPNELVRDPRAEQGRLRRPQMELIAGPVSVLNAPAVARHTSRDLCHGGPTSRAVTPCRV